MGKFAHLHVHTEFSLLDGVSRIKDLVGRVKELGQTACAITDHGVMYGAIDFYKECKAQGIKPIIGCEVYDSPRTRFDKVHEYDSNLSHLILLAKDMKGYENLIYIVSMGFIEGFYGKPRVDEALMREHSEGIICLSACLAGKIPQLILQDNYEGAKEQALTYMDIFGKENFYLEIQDHGILAQKKVNVGIERLSQELGVKMVATNDSHYVRKEDAGVQRVVMCVQMNKTVNDENKFGFEADEFYIKSEEEMRQVLGNFEGAIENTMEIAERCNVEFEFGKLHLPKFDVPEGMTSYEYLKQMCEDGYRMRYGEDETYRERFNYELETIRQMGYVDYFLIVHDFIKYAKDQEIPVGPGRGSAAGSIISYCLRITEIDPIKYNLLFERFLNPERVSMPDIDIDFCYERRGEVIDYVKRKYGADHVAQIVTFGTMAAKGAIRDCGRALDMPYGEVDAVAKLVPNALHITLDKALDVNKEFRERYENEPKVKLLVDTARGAEGLARHSSMHAAGVVISRRPVYCHVPLSKNDENVVTQYTMTVLEELGLLKMDFLGLRTLTVIDNAAKLIRKKGIEFYANKMNYDDPETYDMICRGQTDGVFQLESAGMKQTLVGMKPRNLEDIIAAISLYRPGPMDSIPRYIACKNDPKRIAYQHPLLEPILNMTYGCIVYQEQVMQIVRQLAGYSLGRADLVRRAMSKKKHDVMEQERHNFVYGLVDENGVEQVPGAIKNGVPEQVAINIFNEMMDFASYAFNKSHAACYAVVAYQTAYIKCHYKQEFMAALMTSVIDTSDKVTDYMNECAKLNITVLPPDINESEDVFTVVADNIRFALVAIKNIGKGLIQAVVKERETNGPYTGFYNFLERNMEQELNKRAVENLIKCGAFDSFGDKRSQLLQVYAKAMDDLADRKRKNVEGQTDLFGMGQEEAAPRLELPNIPELSVNERLSMEKAITGIYLSGHPMKFYQNIVDGENILTTRQMKEREDNSYTRVCGIITNVKQKTTKKGQLMCFFTLEDMYGGTEVLVFPQVLDLQARYIAQDSVVLVGGRVSVREEEPPKLVCDTIVPVREEDIAANTDKKLFLRLSFDDAAKMGAVRDILFSNRGGTPVVIYDGQKQEKRRYNRNLWVFYNAAVEDRLKKLLGAENVVLK